MKRLPNLLLLLIIPFSLFSQWTWLNPKPQGNGLKDIAFINSMKGFIAGCYGTLLKTTDGGKNWDVIRLDSTLNMTCISVASPLDIFISTDNGLILRSMDGLQNWQVLDPGYHLRINSIWFTSPDTGYAVGPAWVMKTTDAGDSWTRQQFGPYDEFFAVEFSTPDSGFIGGRNGKIFRTTDSGNSWISCFADTDSTILSFSLLDSQRAYACGTYGTLLKTTDGGQSWEKASSIQFYFRFTDLCYFNPDTGIVVDSEFGNILKTIDGGLSWSYFNNFHNRLEAICFSDRQKGIVVGEYGLIYSTNNCGETWESVSTFTDRSFYSATFLNRDTGFAPHWSGVYKTFDGGNSWTKLKLDGFYDRFYQVVFTDVNTGYIPGDQGRIIKTTDGGMSWNYIYTGFTESHTYVSLCFPSKDTAYVIGQKHVLRSIDAGDSWTEVFYYESLGGFMKFFDNNTGVVSYNSNVFHTYDAGETWEHTTYDAPPLTSFFINPDTGYAIAEYGVLKRTEDGGLTWQTVGVFEPYINDLYFKDYFTGYVFGQYGFLYKTTDAGETWTRQVTGTENSIYFVYEVDTSLVYAGGEGGMLLKYQCGLPVELQDISSEERNISVYPNPFRDQFTIYYDNDEKGPLGIELYDLNGRLVFRDEQEFADPKTLTFAVSGKGWSPGVYILTLKLGVKSRSVKVVKGFDF
jgi:photosystem II stability/assembly factor-like uncharacterized protein